MQSRPSRSQPSPHKSKVKAFSPKKLKKFQIFLSKATFETTSFRNLLPQKQLQSPPSSKFPAPILIKHSENSSHNSAVRNSGWRPLMKSRVQSFINFFRKKTGSHHGSVGSASLEKEKRNKTSKFSERSNVRSRNFLWIVFFVKKFIEILKSYNIHQKLMRLTDYHFELINDKAFYSNLNGMKPGEKIKVTKPFHDLWERTKKNHRILKQLKSFKNFFLYFTTTFRILFEKYVKVFTPENNIRIFWDFIVLFFLILNIFYMPLIIAFELTNSYFNYSAENLLCNMIPNIIFIIDMFVNMNTAYYSKGEYISNRKKIFNNYFRKHLYIDFFTIGPVLIHWISSSILWINEIDAFSLLRLLKIKQLIWKMDECLHLETKAQGLFNLSKLLFVNLFVAHICGCCWNYIGNWQISNYDNKNWIVRNEMANVEVLSRYITCFYWSVTTMITVGYGDIIAFTDIERVFSITVMLLSCAVFAYSLSSIGDFFLFLRIFLIFFCFRKHF